jgi:hypothetical protein
MSKICPGEPILSGVLQQNACPSHLNCSHAPLHWSHSVKLCHVLITTRAAAERFVKQAVTNEQDTVLENYKVTG